MIDEDGRDPKQMSPQLEWYVAFARAMFVPASGLAVIGILGCLAIAGLDKFVCSLPLGMFVREGSNDFVGFALWSVLFLVFIRGMGAHTPELMKKLGYTIDHSFGFLSVHIFSTKVSFSLVTCVATLLGAFAMLLIPIGVVIHELRTVWGACVMATSGSA